MHARSRGSGGGACVRASAPRWPPLFSFFLSAHCLQFLGGCDATLAWLKATYLGGGAAAPPRVAHANDAAEPAGVSYDYDLVVIGGGSGGLSASKEAAALGARVAVLDFVKPSWAGSSWGLGGTCVNVGCIPKKLMHTAALLGESLDDARAYGWAVPGGGAAGGARPAHDWAAMVSAVQDHISSLNFGYRVQLRDKGVKYENALGRFVGPHELELKDKKGAVRTVSARRIVIAVGGRPKALDCPGGDLAISSDDLFSLPASPGKTLVVGASYVALECAGFLAGLGLDTTVAVRSILLRGFDQQIAEQIGAHMAAHGVKFLRPALPASIVKTPGGRLRVTLTVGGGGGDAATTVVDDFDTVFVATGREADTRGLNLAAAGLAPARDGKLACDNEQTAVPHIYAIGDVVVGKPELTPVAIMAGKLLARRLFGGGAEAMDYEKVPTTVFTPLEYGAVGLSEEDAVARFGAAAVEVFHSYFSPLEWTIVESRPQGKCYAKLIVHKADSNRVVGFHILGPNAGEITQGWGAAIKLGATYDTFVSTVGIHPTVSEEFTTLTCVQRPPGSTAPLGGDAPLLYPAPPRPLAAQPLPARRTTKRSGETAEKAGC